MKNRIVCVDTKKQLKKMSLYCNNADTYVVEIDGNIVKTLMDFLHLIWEELKFPYSEEKRSFDGYNDWMHALDEIQNNNIAIIIRNYTNFMCQELDNKDYLINHFKTDVLPFWEYECTHVIVEGKPRGFMVYLLD
jgi:hypothetical protein